MAVATLAAEQRSEAESTGATSHELDWHRIDWYQVQRNVRRLQARIVKAQQEGKYGKVKALQHLLTHSFSGKALAVRRVTENQGKRTPGIDGVTWDTPGKKALAIPALRQRGYRPHALRRTYIPKANGKMRPLGIPTMHDRAMQALYLLAVQPIAETTADATSYGFRPERCTADALVYLHTVLSNAQGAPEWVLEGDIASCFDRISHEWLLAHVPMNKRILRQWLKAGYMEKNAFYQTEDGTPQGGIISPVLANLALDGLARLLQTHFPPIRGKNKMVHLARYADDFVITGVSQAVLEQEVKPLVEGFLSERGLELSPTKTLITKSQTGSISSDKPCGSIRMDTSSRLHPGRAYKPSWRKSDGLSKPIWRWMPATWSCCSIRSLTDGHSIMPSGQALRHSTSPITRYSAVCGPGYADAIRARMHAGAKRNISRPMELTSGASAGKWKTNRDNPTVSTCTAPPTHASDGMCPSARKPTRLIPPGNRTLRSVLT